MSTSTSGPPDTLLAHPSLCSTHQEKPKTCLGSTTSLLSLLLPGHRALLDTGHVSTRQTVPEPHCWLNLHPHGPRSKHVFDTSHSVLCIFGNDCPSYSANKSQLASLGGASLHLVPPLPAMPFLTSFPATTHPLGFSSTLIFGRLPCDPGGCSLSVLTSTHALLTLRVPPAGPSLSPLSRG